MCRSYVHGIDLVASQEKGTEDQQSSIDRVGQWRRYNTMVDAIDELLTVEVGVDGRQWQNMRLNVWWMRCDGTTQYTKAKSACQQQISTHNLLCPSVHIRCDVIVTLLTATCS